MWSAPGQARAAGGVVLEMGIRKLAMGAVVGRPDELAAIYHNPAGLVMTPGVNLFVNLGVSLLDTEMSLRPWSGSNKYFDLPVDDDGYYPAFKPARAYGVIPMLVGSVSFLDDKLVLALGFYVPNAQGAAFDLDSVAKYHLLDSYYIAGAGTLAAAWRPLPNLAVGAGLSLYYMRISGYRKFYPRVNLQGAETDLSALIGGDSDLNLAGDGYSFGFSLGVLWWVLPQLSLGAAMLSRTDVDMTGDVSLTVGEGGASRPGWEFAGTQRTHMMLPWTLQVGINLDLTSWLEVGGELRYFFFSQYTELRTQLQGLESLGLKELTIPKDYRDSYQVSGGVKVTLPPLAGLEVLLGYMYDRTPAPDHTVSMEQPTFSHHSARVGLRHRFSPRFRLAASYVHYWYVERSTNRSVTSPASNFKGGGENHIASLIAEVNILQ